MTSLALVLMMMWMQAQEYQLSHNMIVNGCPNPVLHAWVVNKEALKERGCDNTPDPMDVPAIQAGSHLVKDCNANLMCFDRMIIDYSCSDKSRGLWQTLDGKHWCRKVQP